MRRALVYYKKELAGVLSEEDDGYLFQYHQDYLAAAKANIPEKVIDGLSAHFRKCLPAWEMMIGKSFLTEELKQAYIALLRHRLEW